VELKNRQGGSSMQDHSAIVQLFELSKASEPMVNAMGSEQAKKARDEMQSAIIVYLYACKMSEESKYPTEIFKWSMRAIDYLNIVKLKTEEFNDAVEKMKKGG
jgi:hypothetical protein